MKKLSYVFIIITLLCSPSILKCQSIIQVDIGATIDIQGGADVCSDQKIINGAVTGTGTWCLVPLTPNAPQLSSPSYNATGQLLTVSLVWQKSFGALSYRVQLSTDSLFSFLTVNDSTVTDSIRTVSGLNPLTYYWWRVNAKGLGGTSTYSVVYKFRTLGYPNQAVLISPANNSTNQPVSIQFRWSRATEQANPFSGSDKVKSNTRMNAEVSNSLTDETDAVSNYWFELVTDTVSMANLNRDTTLTDTTKSISGLSNLTNYYWRVKARNQTGWGQFSAWWRFATIIAAPSPPMLLSPTNNSIGQNLSVSLIWNKSPMATSYRVQVSIDSMFSGLIINDSTLTDSTKVITGLNPLSYYWWRVNAKNIGGTSAYSTPYKFKTLGYPNTVSLVNPPNNAVNQPVSIQFRWSRATEQTGPIDGSDHLKMSKGQKTMLSGDLTDEIDVISNYWFELTTDTVSFANLVRDTTLTDTTKTVSGLTYLTTYFWRVKAKNQIGWGSFSSWWRFTTIPLPPALVSLKVIPGGFYNAGTGTLNMRDTIKVLLIDSVSCTRVDSARIFIDSVTFSGTLSFANAQTGTYFLYVYHRNHVVTSSRYEQDVMRGSTVTYDFTTDSAKAYGNNMIKVSTSPLLWGMIPADANQDGYIDGLDQNIWTAQNGLDGYLPADFNGDIYVDGLDQNIWISSNGLSYILPCELTFQTVEDHKKKIGLINNGQLKEIFHKKIR